MNKKIYIMIVDLLFSAILIAQKDFNLNSILTKADSIFIVSHKQTGGIIIINDSTKKETIPKKILENGTLNNYIIIASKKLSSFEKKSLISIFKFDKRDKSIVHCRSFMPNHSILIYNKNIITAVDISLGCNEYCYINEKGENSRHYIGGKTNKKLEVFYSKLKISTSYDLP